jgi:hypothetical protein
VFCVRYKPVLYIVYTNTSLIRVICLGICGHKIVFIFEFRRRRHKSNFKFAIKSALYFEIQFVAS